MHMLFRNASWNLAISAYRAGFGLLSAFLAVRLLGVDGYGNVVTLVSLFALYHSLVSGVFIVLVARLMSPDNRAGASDKEVLFVAANVLAALSVICLFVLTALLNVLAPQLQQSGIISQNFWNYARSGTHLLGLLTVLQIYSTLNSAMIESAGRLDLAMKSQLLGPSVVLFGLVVLISAQSQVTAPAYLSLLCAGAAADMMMLWFRRRALIVERLSPGNLPEALERIPDLLKSGSAIQFASFMNVFLEPLNKLALNHFAGGASVTSYDLAMKVIWGLQGLFGAVMRVFLHISGHGADVINRTYVRVMTLVAVPALAAHAFGALLLSVAIHYWVSVEQGQMMAFYGIATLSNLAMIYVTPLYVSLIGRDDRRFLFQNQLRLTISNIVASLSLVPLFGLIGAAAGLFFAAMYNSAAIHARFRRVVGNMDGIRPALAGMRRSYLLAAILFAASLFFGGAREINLLAFAVILAALSILIAREPVTAELARRLSPGAGR